MPLIQSNPGWASALAGLFGVAGNYFQGQQEAQARKAAADKNAQAQALIQAQIKNYGSLATDRDVTRRATLLKQGLGPDGNPLPLLEDTPTTAPEGTQPGPVQASALGAGAAGAANGADATPTPVDKPTVVAVPHPAGGTTAVVTTPFNKLAAPVVKPATAAPAAAGGATDPRVPGSILQRLGPIPAVFAAAPGTYGQPFREQATTLQQRAEVAQTLADRYRAAGRSDQADSYAKQATALLTEAGKQMSYGNEADTRGQSFENAVWQRYAGMANILHLSQDDIEKIRHDIQTEAQAYATYKQTGVRDSNTLQVALKNIAAKWGIAGMESEDRAAERGVQVRGQNLTNARGIQSDTTTRRGQDLAHPEMANGGKPLTPVQMASAIRAAVANAGKGGLNPPNDPEYPAIVREYTNATPEQRYQMEHGIRIDGTTAVPPTVAAFIRQIGAQLPPSVPTSTGAPAAKGKPKFATPQGLPPGAHYVGPGSKGGDLYAFPDGSRKEWTGP